MKRFPPLLRSPVVRAAQELLDSHRGDHDVVLANDIDTVPLALDLGAPGGVHADLHEYHPRHHDDSLRWRVFVAPYYRWLVRTYGTRADSVSTVAEGLAREYRTRFGLRAVVVANAAPYVEREPTPVGTPPVTTTLARPTRETLPVATMRGRR